MIHIPPLFTESEAYLNYKSSICRAENKYIPIPINLMNQRIEINNRFYYKYFDLISETGKVPITEAADYIEIKKIKNVTENLIIHAKEHFEGSSSNLSLGLLDIIPVIIAYKEYSNKKRLKYFNDNEYINSYIEEKILLPYTQYGLKVLKAEVIDINLPKDLEDLANDEILGNKIKDISNKMPMKQFIKIHCLTLKQLLSNHRIYRLWRLGHFYGAFKFLSLIFSESESVMSAFENCSEKLQSFINPDNLPNTITNSETYNKILNLDSSLTNEEIFQLSMRTLLEDERGFEGVYRGNNDYYGNKISSKIREFLLKKSLPYLKTKKLTTTYLPDYHHYSSISA